VTPQIFGTLASNGWYTTNVTVNWSVVDPESVILSTSGCDAVTLTAETVGTKLTCSATSDGGETTVSKTIKVDKTAPSVTATPARGSDSNGWYNHALSVSFAGSDGISGVATCVAAKTYSGPDSGSASVAGTCTDNAGNVGSASLGLKYDATAPQVTGSSAGRAPDSNGWYNGAVTVTFTGSDATSGVGSCTQATYSGPDAANASVVGGCVDRAGNVSGSAAFALKYDATGPSVTATAARAADANGWFNHALSVSFNGVDATSGLDSCVSAQTYSGPDSSAASISGTCRDQAGNITAKSFGLKYDATKPVVTATAGRNPDANGWYNHALTVSFAGSDGTSGLDSCAAPQSYSGPDNGSASVNGSCLDNAGNLATASLPLKYDATGPNVAATPARGPDANGWYDRAVSVSFSGTDATAGVASCVAPQTYSAPDDAAASVAGSCRDNAGNVTPRTFGLKYDATAPQVTATPARGPDANGWYNHALSVGFTGSDGVSGVSSCVAAKSYSGPDGAGVSVSGTCTDTAGNVGVGALAVKYDATAPSVTGASPARQPDANGWYNHPVGVSFTGTDSVSGPDSCTQTSYGGPDSGTATVSGSCLDVAGNRSASSTFSLKYDATGPSAVATPGRGPDANGWYDRPLTVSFDGSDGFSGVASCSAAQTYAGPDSSGASVGGTCSDRAGNLGTASFALKYDATPPVATAVAARGPDANGWYNHGVGVSFQGNDALSGLDSCAGPVNYTGPDSASAAVSGSCVDRAGNSRVVSLVMKYDTTGPQVAAIPARSPDSNGWYNHPVSVSFAGSDATSGLDSCVAPKAYSGPDGQNGSVGGTCSDNAGNTTARSFGVQYDTTAPVVTGALPGRAADADGWYNHPLTIAFDGADEVSGIDSCSEPSYAGPDAAAASVSGSCFDRAGNVSGTSSFAFKYDATAPKVTDAVPVRPPDHNGWFNHAVVFAFQGQDATAGIDSCSPTTYDGPDRADALVTGTCVDQAGNTGAASFGLQYDATGPGLIAAPSRGPDANGWYNHALAVSFSGSDGASGVESCVPPKSYGGPDSTSASVDGYCLDSAGNPGFGAFALKYDATPPKVTGASPARRPDENGWYRHPLAVDFHGSDETSQVDSCTSATYAGPDNPAATLGGSCRDRAGNVSGALDYGLKYDATPPKLTAVSVTAGDRVAVLRWQASSDTVRVEVARSAGTSGVAAPVYRGTGDSYTDKGLRNGVRYRYTVSGFDAAGNAATKSASAKPTAPLFEPPAGATVSQPPLLAWLPAANARYYNVQVWRRRKIFSAWPSRTKLRLHRSWTYEGRRYRLSPGRYRWYVWPGRGPRSANRYGRMLGGSSFIVR
jgi:hypothetical protein